MVLEDILTTSGKYPERADHADDSVRLHAVVLAERVSKLLTIFRAQYKNQIRERLLTSGFRPKAVNDATPGAAKASLHMTGQACDIEDNDRELALFCLDDLHRLEAIGLWLENPRYTRVHRGNGVWASWLHLQTRPPGSGARVFNPGTSLPVIK